MWNNYSMNFLIPQVHRCIIIMIKKKKTIANKLCNYINSPIIIDSCIIIWTKNIGWIVYLAATIELDFNWSFFPQCCVSSSTTYS